MDTITKKNNKENARPECGSRKVVTKEKAVGKLAPLQSKNDLKEENLGKRDESTKKTKDVETNAVETKRQTLSQAFHTQQLVKHRKLAVEALKPPSTMPPKSLPGTYKGRVIQSKIDCFRKPSSCEGAAETKAVTKPAVPKIGGQKLGTLTKIKSKSIAALPGPPKPRPTQTLHPRPKSVSDAPHTTAKPVQRRAAPKVPVTTRSAPPPSRPPPGPKALPAPSKAATLMKGRVTLQSTKPKAAVSASERRVHKPVTSTLSQYRLPVVETAEERRAKLAEWLASKGKTLKRPPISDRLAPQRRKPAIQPKVDPEPKRVAQPLPFAQPAAAPLPTELLTLDTEADVQTGHEEGPEPKPAPSFSPSHIMNTTLDLLDNSDMDLPELVLNLCNALDAMETPSAFEHDSQACEDDRDVVLEDVRMEEQVKEEKTVQESLENERLAEEDSEGSESESDGSEDANGNYVMNEDEGSEPTVKEEDEVQSDEGSMDTMPTEMAGASVVRYSVKTTPFLQSVRRRIDSEAAPGSGSRRKSGAIKDLKFLTPVRRSRRIQRKSSRLPSMLTDHDPCVSSLAELVRLDDAANAYIYRKNPALLDDLPDHARVLERGSF